MSEKCGHFFRISRKVEFSKTLINQRIVQRQNEYNSENQRKSLGTKLCKYYCLDLYKKINFLRYHIH
jgi:hypothetical protein